MTAEDVEALAIDGAILGGCTFGDDGGPMTSASIEEGDRVYLTNTDKGLIPIKDGNRYPEVYEPIEKALGKPMVSHLKGFLKE